MPLKGCLDLIGVVVTDRAVDRPLRRGAVVTDVLAIAHPVLVPDRLARRIGADLPSFTRIEVKAPDPILYQCPRSLVTEGHNVGVLAEQLEVPQPIILLIDHLREVPPSTGIFKIVEGGWAQISRKPT